MYEDFSILIFYFSLQSPIRFSLNSCACKADCYEYFQYQSAKQKKLSAMKHVNIKVLIKQSCLLWSYQSQLKADCYVLDLSYIRKVVFDMLISDNAQAQLIKNNNRKILCIIAKMFIYKNFYA